jgi:glycosyltransferase involved in cell wall biosynthesis
MTEIKRVDDLLRAFAQVDPRAHLLLVGDGPLRPRLERLAHELGIWARCRFVGYRQDVASIYAACDVVALTSANEGTPVSVIEALAASRPAVATRVGGVPDVVADGVDSFLVPVGDAVALRGAIERVLADAALRAEIGEAARARVAEHCSWERVTERTLQVYAAAA